jgi:anti-sigma28 factor (negative regulator of flagellin synthesis)
MSNTSSVSPVQSSRLEFPASESVAQRLRTAATQQSAEPARADQVEISADAFSLEAQGRVVRTDLVARIRSEIASGTYVTDEKIDRALNGLLTDLGG